MSDWGPAFMSVVLFVLLTPGLLIQLPGSWSSATSKPVLVLIHAIIYFALTYVQQNGRHTGGHVEELDRPLLGCNSNFVLEIIDHCCLDNFLMSKDKQANPFSISHFYRKMADWGPVLIGVVLFVLLQPGLLFQLPGNNRQLEFGTMKTNGKAIAVHTLIFFTLYAILILAIHVHIYTG
ncbi:uncharacterized protein [Primulina huaijiensis]|uniref:uncharacterized protein n=2 Tax=Primulina TaxID=48772 RepID=UPI003CC730D2